MQAIDSGEPTRSDSLLAFMGGAPLRRDLIQRDSVAPGQLLACLDDSPLGDTVFRHALACAAGLDLAVSAARVIEAPRHPSGPVDPLEWQMRRRESRDRLDHLVATRSGKALDVETIVLAGSVADELTGWARDHGAALMAVGSRERQIADAGLGTTAQRILERAPSSLLLVPAAAARTPEYRRILVPLDGSCRAESVLPIATRLARAHGAELILAHVVPRPETLSPNIPGGADELCDRLVRHNESHARDYLDMLQTKLWKERLPVRTLVIADGDPRAQLRKVAIDQQVDLILVSSHGRSGLADVPYGSVTEYLAAHAPAPLLIVKPSFAHAFSTPASLPTQRPAAPAPLHA